MTDEDAFLRSLLNTPADDATRLVYADWLDERGEAAKAEFLRLETVAGKTKKQRKQVEARVRELAADLDPKWLAVVSKMHIENCAAGGTLVGYSWLGEDEKPTYLCPQKWEHLQPTDADDVRFCPNCQKDVHYCDTIQTGRDHTRQGRCVVVDLGVIRRERDLEPRAVMAGLISSEFLDREEERLRLDPVSEKREKAKQPPAESG